ncbi:hypothetical protein FQN57_005479 [Myotisia sp. PD_48]|nr:hypothetical protein FQN57_005479 [Myotisia sp. PD_48]
MEYSPAVRRAGSEAFHKRLESMQALEGAYPEYEEIVHHNLEHMFNVVVPLQHCGGYNKAVDIVQRKEDNRICIRKTFMICSKAKPRRWLREVKAVRVMQHRNIEGYLAASISPAKGEIFLEYCDLGTLAYFKQFMIDHNLGIPESFVWHVFKDILRGLCYMQTGLVDESEFCVEGRPNKSGWIAILHRDIKLENIYLKSPDRVGEYPVVKLGDFGMSISKKDLKMPFATSGTKGWMAPEYPNCSTRSDVFSATTVIQCITVPDWDSADPEAGVGPGFSQLLRECVLSGMTKNKYDRPLARELAQMVFGVPEEQLPAVESIPLEGFCRMLPPKEQRS